MWVLDVQDSFLSPSVAALMAASVAASLAAKIQIHQFSGAMINDPKYNISHLFKANFSAVYRPRFLKHDSPVHDLPVMIRP